MAVSKGGRAVFSSSCFKTQHHSLQRLHHLIHLPSPSSWLSLRASLTSESLLSRFTLHQPASKRSTWRWLHPHDHRRRLDPPHQPDLKLLPLKVTQSILIPRGQRKRFCQSWTLTKSTASAGIHVMGKPAEKPPDITAPSKHLLYHLTKNAKALLRAWYAVLLIFALGLFLGWTITTRMTVPAKDDVIASKDSIIASKNATIEVLQASLKERLMGKDDLIAYYREKLGLISVSKTKYSGMRNRELKDEVNRFVTRLRDYLRAKELQEQKEIPFDAFDPIEQTNYIRLRTLTNNDERATLQAEMSRNWISKENDRFRKRALFEVDIVAGFDKQFRVDAQIIRDELISRIPKEKRDFETNLESAKFDVHMQNSMLFSLIADTLEKSAKILPDAD
jgi:hypothetical protein